RIVHYVHEDTRERLDYYGDKARLGFDESLMATVVMYLSNVSHGGKTLFRKSESKNNQPKEDTWSECVRIGYAVKPLKGNALLFFNVQPNTAPDENISNARCPILQGEKWCATKYFYLKVINIMKISLKSDSDECTDEEDSCPEWAAQGECNRNPIGSQADSGHQQQHNSQFLPLSHQTSFYSLTLDEVQNQLSGKPLGSMNLDELLKNVCTSEDNDNSTFALHHQPSLRKKPSMRFRDIFSKVKTTTILAVIKRIKLRRGNPLSAQWLQYQLPSVQQQQHQQSQQQNMMGVFMPSHPVPQRLPGVPNSLLDTNYPENQLAISSPLMGTLSDTQAPSRKRGASVEMIEKTIKRREKRMIKNREFTARSRARK
ncbi:hypothetical protein IFM89_012732, partial [Coptis chinensis]